MGLKQGAMGIEGSRIETWMTWRHANCKAEESDKAGSEPKPSSYNAPYAPPDSLVRHEARRSYPYTHTGSRPTHMATKLIQALAVAVGPETRSKPHPPMPIPSPNSRPSCPSQGPAASL